MPSAELGPGGKNKSFIPQRPSSWQVAGSIWGKLATQRGTWTKMRGKVSALRFLKWGQGSGPGQTAQANGTTYHILRDLLNNEAFLPSGGDWKCQNMSQLR